MDTAPRICGERRRLREKVRDSPTVLRKFGVQHNTQLAKIIHSAIPWAESFVNDRGNAVNVIAEKH